MGGMDYCHGIGVHDPGHGLRIGVNVRRRNVHRGADDGKDLARVTARHALQLALGHALGVADHPALGAAERNVDGGRFPGHPGGQSLYFV